MTDFYSKIEEKFQFKWIAKRSMFMQELHDITSHQQMYLRKFLSILHEILYCIDNMEYVLIKRKKNRQMSLMSSFDGVILKVICWYLLSFVGIDVFLLVYWVCWIHRKLVTRNNSKKLIIRITFVEKLWQQQ